MMTRSWRRLAEALGPGMINLKISRGMDDTGGPNVDGDDRQPSMRPPMELPSSLRDDHGNVDDMMDDECMGMEDESKFDKMVHHLAQQPGVHDPRKLAAYIGIKKYGSHGMAQKAAAARK